MTEIEQKIEDLREEVRKLKEQMREQGKKAPPPQAKREKRPAATVTDMQVR